MKKENKELRKVLLRLGISSNLEGFNYILAAVNIIENKKGKVKLTEIYEKICRLEKAKTKHSVERAIRYAIELSYKNNKYFREIYYKKPVNHAFLSDLVFNFDLFKEVIEK